jgi:hypothetical protein
MMYKQGTTPIGNITYTYDDAGNRTQIGGSWARTRPAAGGGFTTYNDANQLHGLG